MAVPIYTSDLTTLIPDDVVSAGNWAAIGGGASGLNIETDYFIQGANCMSKNAFASSTKGMVEDTTATALTSGDLSASYTWMTHTTPGSLDTKANGGLRVVMGSSSAAYNEYYYAGKDTIDYGAPWICAVVDPENATASTGTVTHANIDTYGVVAKLVGGPTKGAPLGIDAIRQGRTYDCTEGEIANPADFEGFAAKNDLLANRYGQFQGVPGISGSYTMQCHLSFGTATTPCYFVAENASISLNDLEFVDPDFQLFEVVNGGSTVRWSNITVSAVGTNAKGDFLATSSLLIEHTACTFNGMNTFTYDGNSTITGTKFNGCGVITQTSATFDSCIIDSCPPILANNPSLITDCDFTSSGTGHAVELTNTGTYNWENTNSGYGADGTTDAVVYNNSGGHINLNVIGNGTTPTVRNGTAATTTVISGTVTVQVLITAGGSPLVGASVYVTKVTGGAIVLSGVTDTNGVIEDTGYTYTADEALTGRARYSKEAVYKTGNLSGTITSAGATITQSLILD